MRRLPDLDLRIDAHEPVDGRSPVADGLAQSVALSERVLEPGPRSTAGYGNLARIRLDVDAEGGRELRHVGETPISPSWASAVGRRVRRA